MKLRYYQQEAKQAVYDHLRNRDDNPCVVIPTGGGKTPLISSISNDVYEAEGKILIVSHVKELLEQLYYDLKSLMPLSDIGLYSAGLNKRDTSNQILVGGIQSIYKRPNELNKPDIVIIDECHLIPEDGEGMYQTLFKGLKEINPDVRFVGLTATPYRMKTGEICKPENILNHVCYECGVKELIKKGYLCKIISKNAVAKVDDSDLHLLAGEFNLGEMSKLYSVEGAVDSMVKEVMEYTEERNKVLIFGAGVEHCKMIQERIPGSKTIFGETDPDERANTIEEFKNGELKFLINNDVLTTGFNARNVDCVVLARSTMSPGLYSQMVGRGLRTHDSKENCLLLDYGNNITRHGPIDRIYIPETRKGKKGTAPVKECDNCHSMVHLSVRKCPDCGEDFPVNENARHGGSASEANALSTQQNTYKINHVWYDIHEKKKKDGSISQTLRVDYEWGYRCFTKEWVCFEHSGFARDKAEHWWRTHAVDPNSPIPSTIEEAQKRCEQGEVKKVLVIHTEKPEDSNFERIKFCEFEEPDKDDFLEYDSGEEDYDDEDIPF